MIFLMTKSKLKNIVRMAEKLGWNNGLKEGYGAGHTRGYKEGFETGRLYERSPELFGMNYLTYLDELEYRGWTTNSTMKTNIPLVIREAFNE